MDELNILIDQWTVENQINSRTQIVYLGYNRQKDKQKEARKTHKWKWREMS